MALTKQEAIRIVVNCAHQYQEELEGNSLLFICQSTQKAISFFECSFRPDNFMHLTGLKTARTQTELKKNNNPGAKIVNAVDFYTKCLNRRLSPKDFEFAPDGTTVLKLNVLPRIISKDLSARMIGDFHSSNPCLYTEKLAGGVQACMGFVRDGGTGPYLPNTVLQSDIRSQTDKCDRVLVTYRKKTAQDKYEEITYAAKSVDWDKVCLPPTLKGLQLPYSTHC